MPVIPLPDGPAWSVSRGPFRTLMERLLATCRTEEDAYIVRQAEALDGLHFATLDPDQALRLQRNLVGVARDLRSEFEAAGLHQDDGFRDALVDLERRLRAILQDKA